MSSNIGQTLTFTGTVGTGVHSVDLGTVENGVRVFLHVGVLTGGGTVQFVTSEDGTAWTSYDPDTELQGTGEELGDEFTRMGFDTPAPARYVGVRNTQSMDANVLLWAFGV